MMSRLWDGIFMCVPVLVRWGEAAVMAFKRWRLKRSYTSVNHGEDIELS